MESFLKVIVVLSCATTSFAWKPPTTAEVILSNGYPVVSHKVETEQGYILTLFRIPYGKDGPISLNRPPLILQHGFLCSSACWVIPEPSKGLAYRLADAGFDVWLSNDRGTTYSREHKELDPESADFWDFSFEEMGTEDLPSVIDYVLNKTGQSQITFVGHSQGSTQLVTMVSAKPEYNKKIKVAALLAPAVYLINQRGLLPAIAKIATPLSFVADILGTKHVLDHGFFIHIMGRIFCNGHTIFQPLCDDLYFIISGFDSPQLNKTLVKTITDHCPAGTSVKDLKHLAQLINNGGKFTRYDYGHVGNNIKYHSTKVPEFDVSKLSIPVKIHFSYGDYLSTAAGVAKLMQVLPNAEAFPVSDYNFNHVDFMWATDVNTLLYDKVIMSLKE